MASWACMLAKPATAAPVEVDTTLKDKLIAVVDANAIINMGYGVRSLGELLYTTEDVLKEIRDGKSRQVVEQVEFVCLNPSDESITAVSKFARLTGDLHQLSLEDLRLLALAHMLDTRAHGSAHLRTAPLQVKKFSKQTARGAMPGWGTGGQSDEWAAIDAIEDLELADTESALNGEEEFEESESERGQGAGEGADDAADDGNGDSDGDGDWTVAKRSVNAARKHVRKANRRAAYQQQADEQPEEDLETDKPVIDDNGLDHFRAPGEATNADADADGAGAHDEDADDSESLASDTPAFESNVCLVTADFPMQNVCLQMGLRLVAKDGVRITHLQRFVMRCEGCATVSKDTSKIFCPSCGHATLNRVEVSIGQDGAEHYGVRKKHVLKGTRYSLPKPKGGRNQANPILSEDVYNSKVRKPKKKVVQESDDPFDGTSFGDMKKYANQPSHIAEALSHLTTSARQNPNERASVTRSNRRKR